MGNNVKLTWHTEKRRLGDLIEWDKNPRQLKDHDAEHLKKSLDAFGVADPLIINIDNKIIADICAAELCCRADISQMTL